MYDLLFLMAYWMVGLGVCLYKATTTDLTHRMGKADEQTFLICATIMFWPAILLYTDECSEDA